MYIQLNVNNQIYEVDVHQEMPLLWVLRDVIGLTGTKYGCGMEICGACTVLVEGECVKSCDLKASEVKGRKITTIEGLSPDRSHPLQKAWIAEQVPQCGYCQSGMLMRYAELLKKKPHPTPADIDKITNICACGTYNRIRAAVTRAANGG